MFKFPEDLYCDIRIEREFKTVILYSKGELDDNKEQSYCGAFIRVFDGDMWYYSSITDENKIQDEIEKLASLATRNNKINDNPIVKSFEVNKSNELKYEDVSVKNISNSDKDAYLKGFFDIVKGFNEITTWGARYVDRYIVKEFYSSKGSNIKYDNNVAGVAIRYTIKDKEEVFSNFWKTMIDSLNESDEARESLKNNITESINFVKNAKQIEAGEYVAVLSPVVAGVFAHESFGHKSEADFMIGDESMKEEWQIGKKVGSDILSIVDTGDIEGSGYVPFDDEGTKFTKTYLIKNGVLAGRLQDSTTASLLCEETTGNGRAMNFEFEPIPRMTNTYIEGGDKTFEELIAEIKDGIYIKDLAHGSGMSTFTIAPTISYRIRDGKIAEPVKISVVTGNVFETLNLIDGLSKEVELFSFVVGGCGKFEQSPLPVGFGGPYVRVKNLFAQ